METLDWVKCFVQSAQSRHGRWKSSSNNEETQKAVLIKISQFTENFLDNQQFLSPLTVIGSTLETFLPSPEK